MGLGHEQHAGRALSPLAELRWKAAVSGAALGLGVGMAVGSTLGWTVLRLKRDAQVRVSPKFGTILGVDDGGEVLMAVKLRAEGRLRAGVPSGSTHRLRC